MRIPGRITHELDKVPSDLKTRIPHLMMDSLRRYFEDGIETGGFLRAVLENDLMRAVKNSHMTNPPTLLRDLINVLIGYCPANAWGSKEAVAEWLKWEDAA